MKCIICKGDLNKKFNKKICKKCYYKKYYKNNKKTCIEYQKKYNKTIKGKKSILKNKKNRDISIRENNNIKIFDKVLNCYIKKGTINCRKARLKKMGINYKDFLKQIEKQNYYCTICKIRFKNEYYKYPNQDHCHKTGKIRDILCTKCNLMLGQCKDNIQTLKKYINYLNRFNNGK